MSRLHRSEIEAAEARLRTEDLKPLRELAQFIFKGVSHATATRYVFRGRAGFHLDAIMIAGEWHTSREAIERFHALQKSIGARTD